MQKLTTVIITNNEEGNILQCIRSVKDLADEILVVDSFSADRTTEICQAEGCRVLHHAFEGYGQQKQYGVEQAVNDWILSLDADEIVTPELKQEIRSLLEKDEVPFCGYEIPFSLFYMGRVLNHSGTRNEFHLRLFDRRRGRFTLVNVHEGVELDCPEGFLKGRILHYSFRSLHHHLQKLNTYTTQAAEGYVTKGRKYSKVWVAFKFPLSFFLTYIVKLGFLDGYPGFLYSWFAALYSTLKIAKTIELQEIQK
jgi:glycosyltransferase involved in cell wall biosynthesis